MTAPDWLTLILHSSDPDRHSWELLELGVASVTEQIPGVLAVLIDSVDRDRILASMSTEGLTLCSEAALTAQQWGQSWPEVWQPVHAGALIVLPVQSSEDQPPSDEVPNKQTLRIIPGLGFGTGHHPSTKRALELLQHPLIAASRPTRVLDVGTGNGILALAASCLYGAEILAVDNDPLAIENAAQNTQLNPRLAIQLATSTIDAVVGQFDLVTANIYAEVLTQIEPSLYERCAPRGHLVMAGVMSDRQELLQQGFVTSRWHWIEHQMRDSWAAYILRRTE